ncbi:PREDICTED: myeloid differentiation primary response protein MyD88-A [Papilio xuthus]|uniref:Myeloid differentiation primary response protein MyD88 n=1 Tax=Papilio xuthus TaxID=66420 RepID=A0A194Q3S9_PAPXU|nr:PREDICTED: myeloid differentiation primary response protein MyD88-A [Papilio xuthus]KPJ00192.1 Myeloid differentiation primary response protein MyD88 [Papilio xuthus]
MDQDTNLYDIPLSWLTNESRNLLSNLLNSTKVLPSDGPEKLPRYWRGLASLANISAEVAANVELQSDRTAKVLEIWMSDNPKTAYVGFLLEYLQRLDRYDVFDDCIELLRHGRLIGRPNDNPLRLSMEVPDDDSLITYEDRMYGEPQYYHAYVVYAQEDKDFVDHLLARMRAQGFRLCTEEDLLPGHSTQYAPVSRLISERCQRIILVYSPDFLKCNANSYYTNYAQAVAIERKQLKIIPLVYRPCQLPMQLTYYHKLYYPSQHLKPPYDFWQRLSDTLKITNIPRLNSTGSNHAVAIREVTTNNNTFESRNIANGFTANKTAFLQLPSIPSIKSISMSGLDSCDKITLDDNKSLGNVSQLSEGKQKKPNKIKSFINSLKKKPKKSLAVMNS